MKYVLFGIDKLEEGLMFLGMLAMILLNFFNVFCRFLLPQTPFSYTEELTVLIFIWVTMFGASCAYKRLAHTSLTLLTDLMPPALKKLAAVFGSLCSAGLALMIAMKGFLMVENQMTHGQIMPGLQIPAATAGLAIPIGAIFILFRSLQGGVITIRQIDQEKEDK